jgi:hypothetical protein
VIATTEQKDIDAAGRIWELIFDYHSIVRESGKFERVTQEIERLLPRPVFGWSRFSVIVIFEAGCNLIRYFIFQNVSVEVVDSSFI